MHDENPSSFGTPSSSTISTVEIMGEPRRKRDDLGRWQYLGKDGSWYLSSDDGPVVTGRRSHSTHPSWLRWRWGVGVMVLVAVTAVILGHSPPIASQPSAHLSLPTKAPSVPVALTPTTTVPVASTSMVVPTGSVVQPEVLSPSVLPPTSAPASIAPEAPVQPATQMVAAPEALSDPPQPSPIAPPATSQPWTTDHQMPASSPRSDRGPWQW